MKTLHIDTGRQMHGGQWQALYLMERLPNPMLLAPGQSELLAEVRQRGMDAQPFSMARLALAARHADLVHAHDARAHMLAAVACHIPIVVSRRVAFPIGTGALSRWKYGRATLYIAVSQFVKGRLESAGIRPEKVRVVYDGVPIPTAACPKPGRIVALETKGGEMIRAAARIAGVRVHFTSRLWDDLAAAALFVYVSKMEGLGSAAIAAAAAGVPVIASGVGGLPEAVEHDRTGLIVPNRAEKLAQAILRLVNDPQAAQEMGTRGRMRAIEKFSVEAMVAGTRYVYQEAAGCSSS